MFTTLLVAACLVPAALPLAADMDDDANAALAACASIADDTERMRCYDILGERALAAAGERAASADTTTAKPATGGTEAMPAGKAPVLPATLGGARFESEAEEGKQPESGLVTSCEQGRDKRWTFYFEGGQAWKQADNKRLRFDECRFEVTIAKDLLGYKMDIAEQSTTVRVSRRR